MGSLMPGWDTRSDAARTIERSKTSLTKDEIEEFWRLKQKEAEAQTQNHANSELLKISETTTATTTTTTTVTSDGGSDTQEVPQEVDIAWKQPTATSPDWWARSNWAYLNAPPEIPDYPEQPRYRPYVPQHDVAARFSRSVSSRI